METKNDLAPKLDHGQELKEGSALMSVNPYERLQFDFTNNQGKLITVKLSDSGQEDPFMATDPATKAPVKLNKHERAAAYYQLGLKPPLSLTEGLRKQARIKRLKSKPKPRVGPIHSPHEDPPEIE